MFANSLHLAALLALPLQSGGFTDGQLVLYDPALNGSVSSAGGIAIVDPLSGAITKPYNFQLTPQRFDGVCYDPFRDRIICNAQPNVGDPLTLLAGDAFGSYESLGVEGPPCQAFAPVGDGRIYFRLSEAPVNGIRILDANDGISLLLDGNDEPYIAPNNGFWNHMEYHAATNSLVLATGTFAAPCGPPQDVTVRRIDLSPDGTRALGDTCATFTAEPGGASKPTGLAPFGTDAMLMAVDVGGTEAPRLLRVNVDPLAIGVYSTTDYVGAAGTDAGTYSRLRGQAVVYDTINNALRAFSAGQGGEGVLVTPVDSLGAIGGFGQTASLVEVVKPTSLMGLLCPAPTAVGIVTGGSVTLELDLGPEAAGDLYLMLGSLTGVGPGLPVGGATLPLIADAYTELTLLGSGGSPLSKALATLDGQGQATVTFGVGALPPEFAGLVAQHAAILFDSSTLVVLGATNAVPLPFIP